VGTIYRICKRNAAIFEKRLRRFVLRAAFSNRAALPGSSGYSGSMMSRSPLLTTFLAAILLALWSSHVIAAPAAFYKWRSKTDGKIACSQTPLGPGWERAAGPFRDSHCEKRTIVK
jgi:hypothetical protein